MKSKSNMPMKGTKVLTAILVLGLFSSCQQKKEDPEILKRILSDYFDGIRTRDLDKLNSLTTTDFILFEDGKIWTNDSLIKVFSDVTSFKGTWTFDNMKVSIDETSGDIIYHNHVDFIINDTIKTEADLLENAMFKKVDGQWKMKFLHSTVRR